MKGALFFLYVAIGAGWLMYSLVHIPIVQVMSRAPLGARVMLMLTFAVQIFVWPAVLCFVVVKRDDTSRRLAELQDDLVKLDRIFDEDERRAANLAEWERRNPPPPWPARLLQRVAMAWWRVRLRIERLVCAVAGHRLTSWSHARDGFFECSRQCLRCDAGLGSAREPRYVCLDPACRAAASTDFAGACCCPGCAK